VIIKAGFDYTFLTGRQKREHRSQDGRDITAPILSERTLVDQPKENELEYHVMTVNNHGGFGQCVFVVITNLWDSKNTML